jgi:hypothetical protein
MGVQKLAKHAQLPYSRSFKIKQRVIFFTNYKSYASQFHEPKKVNYSMKMFICDFLATLVQISNCRRYKGTKCTVMHK